MARRRALLAAVPATAAAATVAWHAEAMIIALCAAIGAVLVAVVVLALLGAFVEIRTDQLKITWRFRERRKPR